MVQVRCEICHMKVPTTKILISHYMNNHSKFNLARVIIRMTVLNKIPKLFTKKKNIKTENGSENIDITSEKAETLFNYDNFQILHRNNEIIIRDDKSSVDMEFSFDENSIETEENYFVPEREDKELKGENNPIEEVNNNEFNKENKLINTLRYRNKVSEPIMRLNTSSSSASSEESFKKFSFKRKIRKRRGTREKTRHYKINITRLRNCESLDENTALCEVKKFKKKFN